MPKTEINQALAKRTVTAAKRVHAHRAQDAPTLRKAFDLLTTMVQTLASLHAESDGTLNGEIELLRSMCKRFVGKVKGQQFTRTILLRKAVEDATALERALNEVSRKGYGIRRLTAESERDLRLTKTARANLERRSREAAFVLAELEQLVNPVSGLKLVSATQRAENEKRRKALLNPKSPETPSKAPAVEEAPAAPTS